MHTQAHPASSDDVRRAGMAPQPRAQVSDNLRMLESALHAGLDHLLALAAKAAGDGAQRPDAGAEATARLSTLINVLDLAGAAAAASTLTMVRDAWRADGATAQALWSLHDYLDALRDKSGDSDICDLLLFTACRRLQPGASGDGESEPVPSAILVPVNISSDARARSAVFGRALADLHADLGFAPTLAALRTMAAATDGFPDLQFAHAFLRRLCDGVQPLELQAISVLDSLGVLLAAVTADPASVPVRAALARRRIEFLQTLVDDEARLPARPGEQSQHMLRLMLLADELQVAWDRCVSAGATAGRIGAAWQWCESVLRAAAVSRRIWPRQRGAGMTGFLGALGRLAFDMAMSPRAESRDREVSSCLIFFDECLRRRIYLEDEFIGQVDCIIDHLARLTYGDDTEPESFPWFARELRVDMASRMEGVIEREAAGQLVQIELALETLWSPSYIEAAHSAQSLADDGEGAGEFVASPAALISDINAELARIEDLASQFRSEEMRELATALRRQIAAQLPATLHLPEHLQDARTHRRADTVRAGMVRDLVRLGELLDQACRSPYNKWRRHPDAQQEIAAGAQLAAALRRALDSAEDTPPGAPQTPSDGAVLGDDEPGAWQPEGNDPEMMEVFLLEARQLLDSLRTDLPRLGDAGAEADIELLSAVRRCFHTFKGSGRMVGLAAFSDAAQAVEMLLNVCLSAARDSGHVALPAPVAALVERARLTFGAWVEELAGEGRSRRQAPSLISAALALRNDVAQQPPGHEAAAAAAHQAHQPPQPHHPHQPSQPKQVVPASDAASSPSVGEVPADADGDPRLREIFLKEARQIFKLLRQHGSSWRAKADSGLLAGAPPLYQRAVHTLRGTSAAAGFPGMQQMAALLDDVLEQIKASSGGLDGQGLGVVERAVAAMTALLEQYAAGALPQAPPQALAELAGLLGELRGEGHAGAAAQAPVAASAPATESRAAVTLQDEIDHELLPVFLEEGHDLMAAVGEGLQRFQQDPADRAALTELRRPLHTVKGSARMAGALSLGQRMHELESGIQRLLAGEGGAAEIRALLSLYDHALTQFESLEQLGAQQRGEGGLAAAQPLSSPLVRIRASMLDKLLNQVGEVSIARSQLENEVAALHRASRELADSIAKLAGQLRGVEIQAEIRIAASHQADGESAQFDPLELDRYTHLQELTRMMAESVNDAASLQKQLLDSAAKTQDGLQTQGRLTRELQQELMYARMVKFKSIEQRLQHLVRQLAGETGKQLDLDVAGGATEIDRGILERLAGPLEHLLRNAAVHGIEDAGARAASGKAASGRLSVQAAQEGNEAVIRIADDGAGLDLAAIRRKAVEQGLVAEDAIEGARLSELIFEPGFTTTSQVSALAGRGVGMDVVRSEVTALGGRITVQSRPGEGVCFTMHLPLSLAVKQVCLLRHGGQSYAIPSMLVDKVVQLRGEEMRRALAEQVVQANGRMVVLHSLHGLLDEPLEESRLPPASIYVLFVKSGEDLVAIMVDHVNGNREVVAKPLGPQLDTLVGVVGATVLGNGEIALIINPLLLARRIGSRRLGMRREAAAARVQQKVVMVVDDSLTVRKVMQRLLERERYAVATATDGYDAIRQLHDVTPDVFLVDIEMPRMDGFTLVRHLRDNASTHDRPIIMITSRTGAKHRERAMEVGVNHYLGKPYQDEQLLELLRHYTGDRSQRPADDFSDVLY
ncbi:hypothetical protein CEJ42_18245 [Herbaspirillum robiniae]|uniref:Chemotaxis protein CheA n=2 Tax=Herbaspirillum robiniae TaxID=2014887 RepID=A0A246WMD0_9BURK|nr:hypothetical protein CEJ42_18245 [Herbaspirillum robiniae]